MTDLERLTAKDQISECIYRLFIGTDQRDWRKVRDCLADVVRLDMTSLAGGDPVELTPAQITDAWENGLAKIEHVHHQAGNLLIDVKANQATAFCYGIALHHRNLPIADNVRRFVGSYEFELQRTDGRWVISSFRFVVKFVDGNLKLDDAG